MVEINPTGKKMILSIDGGGMRGIIPIAMLAELEAATGRRVQDMFDMVAGTSTGAVITAAIALGMSAQEILDRVYRETLPKAFPPRNAALFLRYLSGGLRSLYRIEPFLEALGPLARGITIGAIEKPIILMTTKDLRNGSTYYIVNRGPGRAVFADWPLVGAVAASSAAPILFPPVAGNLIDGGVGSDTNPCLAAAVEAMEYMGAEEGFVDEQVILISLGTGYAFNRYADGAADLFTLRDWVFYLLLSSLDDSALSQAVSTRAIYGKRLDFRRLNPLLNRESVAEHLGIDIDHYPDPAQLMLDSCALAEIDLMEAIGRAYARRIDWTQPGLMPWNTPGGHAKPGLLQPQPVVQPIDWSKTPFAPYC